MDVNQFIETFSTSYNGFVKLLNKQIFEPVNCILFKRISIALYTGCSFIKTHLPLESLIGEGQKKTIYG